MTISKSQSYNIALNILGVTTPLENSNLQDNRAILLNNYYDLARDCVLKDYDWNFASTFRELSKVENGENYSKYKNSFSYPNNCISARDIFEKNTYVLSEFKVTTLENGERLILCDLEKPVLRYTRRVEKEVYFSSEFAMALAYYLASLVSCAITGSQQKAELAGEKYKKLLNRAKVLNATEGNDFCDLEETYLEARG